MTSDEPSSQLDVSAVVVADAAAAPLLSDFPRLLRTAGARESEHRSGQRTASTPPPSPPPLSARICAPAALRKDKPTLQEVTDPDSDPATATSTDRNIDHARSARRKEILISTSWFFFKCSYKLGFDWCGGADHFPPAAGACLCINTRTVRGRLYHRAWLINDNKRDFIGLRQRFFTWRRRREKSTLVAVNQAGRIEPECKTNGLGMVPTPQVCVSTLVTVSTMAVVDLYLLEQSMLGARGLPGPGVWQCAAVLLGDVGFLLALRFVSAGVVSEARSPRRGFANALWFLFLSLLQLKLFFVCHNYRQERRPPDPLARKTLTLLLSICLPSLFLILTGADHMTPQRRKQEVRSRLLWVVVDLLDVLDLQAGLWEAQGGATGGAGGIVEQKLPIWVEGLVFFYCYALLLLLPCVALTELGATGLPGQRGPRKEALYPWLSLVTINIFTLALRGTGMLWYRDPRVSTVFLGKNLLALAVKLSSAWEKHKQDRDAAGAGTVTGSEPGESTLPSQSSGQGEDPAQEKAPPAHYHTLSRTQSHTLSHVSLEPTETPLGPSFISHEL